MTPVSLFYRESPCSGQENSALTMGHTLCGGTGPRERSRGQELRRGAEGWGIRNSRVQRSPSSKAQQTGLDISMFPLKSVGDAWPSGDQGPD